MVLEEKRKHFLGLYPRTLKLFSLDLLTRTWNNHTHQQRRVIWNLTLKKADLSSIQGSTDHPPQGSLSEALSRMVFKFAPL